VKFYRYDSKTREAPQLACDCRDIERAVYAHGIASQARNDPWRSGVSAVKSGDHTI
jgi:hypothetical protein